MISPLSTEHCVYYKYKGQLFTVMPYQWKKKEDKYIYYCYWVEEGIVKQSKFGTIANNGIEALDNFKNKTNLTLLSELINI